MHHLDPAIRTMRDTSARLAVALGAVGYLSSAINSDDEATVGNALDVLEAVERDLKSALSALISLGAQLNELTDDLVDIALDAGGLHVYPSPDEEGLDIILGEVRVIAPAGPVLDQLVDQLTELRRTVTEAKTPIPVS